MYILNRKYNVQTHTFRFITQHNEDYNKTDSYKKDYYRIVYMKRVLYQKYLHLC